jgi:dipeptidyl aminopeptidase/acylaminoacyl peptidase
VSTRPSAAASSAAAALLQTPPQNGTVEPTARTESQKQREAVFAPLATTVVDAYANWTGPFSSLVASWSPDGKRVLFGSTREGTPEIYEGDVARPDGVPRTITAGPERALSASYTADGKAILFLRDSGGNENFHIWRVDLDGSKPVDLTPGEPMERSEPFLLRKKPGTIIFDGTYTSSPQSFVFTQSLEGGPSKLVYTNPRPGSLADVTSDGARALFFDIRSASDSVVMEIEVATGRARRLYPAEGKQVAPSDASYSPDGKRIYVSTDEGGESSVVLALDATSGRELARYVNGSPPAARTLLQVSPTGDRIALKVDCGNHAELRILDAHTLEVQRDVKVPLGQVMLGKYRDDGAGFSVLLSTPDRPGDPYWVDARTGALRPLRDERRKGLDDLPPIDASIDNVTAFDGLTIPINRYLPRREATARLPTIIMFHGGPASSSLVRWNPYARFFVSLGYAVLEPNVRGSTGFGRAYEIADNREKREDWLKDVQTVNEWAKRQPWCDPDRVVVWGQSYGGYTTLMALSRQPALWRAGVDLYGPVDLKTLLRTTDQGIRSLFVTEFGDVDQDGPLLDRFSPIRDVDRIVAPLFVYTGQHDPRVPRAESDVLVAALRRRRVPVEYMVAADEGHAVDRRENKIELLTRTARFLEDALRGGSPEKPQER